MRHSRKIVTGWLVLMIGLSVTGIGFAQEGAPMDAEPQTGPTTIDIAIRTKMNMAIDRVQPVEAVEEPAATLVVPEIKETKPTQEPGVEKKIPAFAKPVMEAAYKTDPAYLAVDRFERPYVAPSIKNRGRLKIELNRDIGKAIKVIDKPLTLGGRGFEIGSLESEEKYKLHFVFERHLEDSMPRAVKKKKPVSLDSSLEWVEKEKYLIFHPMQPVFGPPTDIVEKTESPLISVRKKIYMPPVEAVPETMVLLGRNKKTILRLVPSEKPLNLLTDPQSIIKYNWKILQSGGS